MCSNYGLKENEINLIQSVFNNYPQITKAILYGSRAKGNYKTGSDIDLTLIGENINLTFLQKIENQLDDLLLPYKIDLSIFAKINNKELKEHIKRVGIIFYKSE